MTLQVDPKKGPFSSGDTPAALAVSNLFGGGIVYNL